MNYISFNEYLNKYLKFKLLSNAFDGDRLWLDDVIEQFYTIH